MNDVLSQTIGKSEHHGRVQGDSTYGTWRDFFQRPTRGMKQLQEDIFAYENAREIHWKQKFASLETKFDERFNAFEARFMGSSNPPPVPPQYETTPPVPFFQYELVPPPQQYESPVPPPQQYAHTYYVPQTANPYVSTLVYHGPQDTLCQLCDEMLNLVVMGNVVQTGGNTIHGIPLDYNSIALAFLKQSSQVQLYRFLCLARWR